VSIPSPYGPLFLAVLQHCSSLKEFSSPWDFVPPNADCFTTIGDPTNALRDLRAQFGDQYLVYAGVLEPGPDRELRFAPSLCNPVGTIIALRCEIGGPPFALLTARGCLPVQPKPIRASMQDWWTRTRVRELGFIVATPDIREVALYRSLGIPATLFIGWQELSEDELRWLDDMFESPEPELESAYVAAINEYAEEEKAKAAKAETERLRVEKALVEMEKSETTTAESANAVKADADNSEIDAAEADLSANPDPGEGPSVEPTPSERRRPFLLLAGWSLRYLQIEPRGAIRRAATYLMEVRQFLGVDFDGICVTKADDEFIKTLNLCFRFPNIVRVRDLLLELCLNSSYGFENIVPAIERPPADFPTTWTELLVALASDSRSNSGAAALRLARQQYDVATHRELIEPLLRMAVEYSDPILRNSGVQFAVLANLIQKMSPMLFDLMNRSSLGGRSGESAPFPERELKQFLAMVARTGNFARDIDRLRSHRGFGRGR
jgi:hypothetical protein